MTVRLTASDFYTFFSPSKCELRVYLKHIDHRGYYVKNPELFHNEKIGEKIGDVVD
jgi:hypothetical protein